MNTCTMDKKIRIVNGSLLEPVAVGEKASIAFVTGAVHTSTLSKVIYESDAISLFVTQNTVYIVRKQKECDDSMKSYCLNVLSNALYTWNETGKTMSSGDLGNRAFFEIPHEEVTKKWALSTLSKWRKSMIQYFKKNFSTLDRDTFSDPETIITIAITSTLSDMISYDCPVIRDNWLNESFEPGKHAAEILSWAANSIA